MAGRDSACDGTTLMFYVFFNLGGMAHEGIVCPSLSVSQFPNRVSNLMWGPFYVDGSEPICYMKACELVVKGVKNSPLGIILQASLCASQPCPMLR